ncbi:MAG TPA: hypothetical protein VKG24_30250 [Pseudolabrys sp.]|jgi:hypothetical protein|nr:hypothetical protein [Pseudolabrys sp.]
MRTVYVILVLGLLASISGVSQAADLSLERGVAKRGAAHDVRLRVVEQVPYCGDCEAPFGRAHFARPRLRYVGFPIWERGCALGGCYGFYYVADSCYFRDTLVRNARGRLVPGTGEFCD